MDSDGYIIRQDVLLVSLVGYLGDYVVTDTEALDMDLTVFIGHIFLAESIAGNISAFHTESEPFQNAIFRCLFDTDITNLSVMIKPFPASFSTITVLPSSLMEKA